MKSVFSKFKKDSTQDFGDDLTLDDRSKSDKIEGGRSGRWVTIRGKHIFLAKGEKVFFKKDGSHVVMTKEEHSKKMKEKTEKKIERKGYEKKRAKEKVKKQQEKRKIKAEFKESPKRKLLEKVKKMEEAEKKHKEELPKKEEKIEPKKEKKPKKLSVKKTDWASYRRKRKVDAIKTQEKELVKLAKKAGVADVINFVVETLNDAYNGKDVDLSAFGRAYDKIQRKKKMKKERKERILNRIKTLEKEVEELDKIQITRLESELKELKKLDFTITPLTLDKKPITKTNPKGAGRKSKRGVRKGSIGALTGGAKRTKVGKALRAMDPEIFKVEEPEIVTIERPSGTTKIRTIPIGIELSGYQFVNTETGAIVSGIVEEDPTRFLKQLTPVSSTNVRGAGQFNNELIVQFHPQGRKLYTYRYQFRDPEVAEQAYEALTTTKSPGKWIWKYIRGHQKGQVVTPKKIGPSIKPPGKGIPTIGGTSASLAKYSVSARSPITRVSNFEAAVKQLKRSSSNPIGKVGRPRTRGQNKRGVQTGQKIERSLLNVKQIRGKSPSMGTNIAKRVTFKGLGDMKRLDFRYVGKVMREDVESKKVLGLRMGENREDHRSKEMVLEVLSYNLGDVIFRSKRQDWWDEMLKKFPEIKKYVGKTKETDHPEDAPQELLEKIGRFIIKKEDIYESIEKGFYKEVVGKEGENTVNLIMKGINVNPGPESLNLAYKSDVGAIVEGEIIGENTWGDGDVMINHKVLYEFDPEDPEEILEGMIKYGEDVFLGIWTMEDTMREYEEEYGEDDIELSYYEREYEMPTANKFIDEIKKRIKEEKGNGKGKGQGWWGESERHSTAAKKGKRKDMEEDDNNSQMVLKSEFGIDLANKFSKGSYIYHGTDVPLGLLESRDIKVGESLDEEGAIFFTTVLEEAYTYGDTIIAVPVDKLQSYTIEKNKHGNEKEQDTVMIEEDIDLPETTLIHSHGKWYGLNEYHKKIDPEEYESMEFMGVEIEEDPEEVKETINKLNEPSKEGNGKGWWGESERHSQAARKGKRRDLVEDAEEGRWITLNADPDNPETKGTKILIKKGQTVKQAIREKFGKKERKKSSKLEKAKKDIKERVKQIETKKDVESFRKWYFDKYTNTDEGEALYHEIGTTMKLFYHFSKRNPVLLEKNKFIMRENSPDVTLMLEKDPEAKQLLIEVGTFIAEKQKGKKFDIKIGTQPISIAGSISGFRAGIPPKNATLELLLPYDYNVKKKFQELEKGGVPSRVLWTTWDLFHEYGHTQGIEDEKKADQFALKLTKEFLSKRKNQDFLTYDLIDLSEFDVITPTEDMGITRDFTHLRGSIARDGGYDYLKNGQMITLYKDYNNLQDIYSRYDYAPVKVGIKDGAHYATEDGFAYNFIPNNKKNTIDLDIILLKDLTDYIESSKLKKKYHVSAGYHDKVIGNKQYMIDLDHIAISLGGKEKGRACTGVNEKGESCTFVAPVDHDQNLTEVSNNA